MNVTINRPYLKDQLRQLIYARISSCMGNITVDSFDGADSYDPSHRPAEWNRKHLADRVQLISSGSMSFDSSTGTITVTLNYNATPV